MELNVTVYLLPYPRRNLLVSSTSGNTIFLSPHVREIHPAVCAYIVAHELGHVFHNAYMPEGSPLWDDYMWIRGITNTNVFYARATHAYRPREIFAEDFRVLFGGRDAAFDGRIENPELPSPTLVHGLLDFVSDIGGRLPTSRSVISVTSYPNPFNPETEIRVVISDAMVRAGERVTVRIYDIRGALVKELYSDVPIGDHLYVRWNGIDNSGNAVASAPLLRFDRSRCVAGDFETGAFEVIGRRADRAKDRISTPLSPAGRAKSILPNQLARPSRGIFSAQTLGPQLAARGVDVGAPATPDGNGRRQRQQNLNEPLDFFFAHALECAGASRIVRDQVDFDGQPPRQVGQASGVVVRRVDAPEHDVLQRGAPPLAPHEVQCGVQQISDRVPRCLGHQLASLLVRRCVEGKRQRTTHIFIGETGEYDREIPTSKP